MAGKILVRGARQLLTLQGPKESRRGAVLNALDIIHDGAVLLQEGRVLTMGPSRRVENLAVSRDAREINAAGRVVMPGFVDSRARILVPRPVPFPTEDAAGDVEFRRALKELTALPSRSLAARAQSVLAGMSRHGTTTVSAATIPAVERSANLKMLRVFASLHGRPLDVIPTFYGAPFVPPEFAGDQAAYVESLCKEQIPVIARRNLARFVEVNCGVFQQELAQRYLEIARNLGLLMRVHAGASPWAARLAVALNAASVTVEDIAHEEIASLAKSRTIALLSPAFRSERSAGDSSPARALIDAGAAVALASSFGLERGATYNMQMVMSLACSEMGMSPAEAISAATINGAYAVGCGDQCGSLEPGKRADLLVLNVQDYREVAHPFGVNHVHMVVKNGAIVYQEGEVAGCSGR